ncbi:MAG TPA: protease complex subunit PrcB family protein [Thermoanaerobaculia bacterium]|nr:protease complex subunit PrcB family protein [Thermoanaerobaculia bacterium]
MKIRSCGAFLIVFVMAACAASPASNDAEHGGEETESPMQSEAVDFSLIEKGAYGKAARSDVERTAPFVEVATSDGEFSRLWREHISDQVPSMDLSDAAAVFLLVGPRSTGGYSIEPRWVRREENALLVGADLNEPGPGDMVTQAFTAPFAVIRVTARGFDRVDWVRDDQVLARKNLDR